MKQRLFKVASMGQQFFNKNKKKVVPFALAFMLLAMNTVAYASGTTGTIDESVFTTIINGTKSVLGLFTVFPINIFLAIGVLGSAAGLAFKLKRS